MLTIRMRRVGAKKKPRFRLVVTEARSAPDGAAMEVIGHYNPTSEPETIELDRQRLQHWLDRGAQLTDTVRTLVARHPEAAVIDADADADAAAAEPPPTAEASAAVEPPPTPEASAAVEPPPTPEAAATAEAPTAESPAATETPAAAEAPATSEPEASEGAAAKVEAS